MCQHEGHVTIDKMYTNKRAKKWNAFGSDLHTGITVHVIQFVDELNETKMWRKKTSNQSIAKQLNTWPTKKNAICVEKKSYSKHKIISFFLGQFTKWILQSLGWCSSMNVVWFLSQLKIIVCRMMLCLQIQKNRNDTTVHSAHIVCVRVCFFARYDVHDIIIMMLKCSTNKQWQLQK